MTRIDAHLHVWDRGAADYPWLGPNLGELDRDVAIDEVLPWLDAAEIDGVVLVQAADDARDTSLMLAAADRTPQVVGVVGWLPLERPADVARALETGLDARIVGVRALIHDMADPDWLLRADVARSLELLAAAGLSYDVVTSGPAALRLVPLLAAAHPELRIVVDHLGKPPLGGDPAALADWRALLAACATHRRVSAKLSGLAAGGPDPSAWGDADVAAVVDTALELFGPARLLYGSDWPISDLAGGYARVHDALEAATSRLSPAEIDDVFGGTAARVYRLDPVRLAAASIASV